MRGGGYGYGRPGSNAKVIEELARDSDLHDPAPPGKQTWRPMSWGAGIRLTQFSIILRQSWCTITDLRLAWFGNRRPSRFEVLSQKSATSGKAGGLGGGGAARGRLTLRAIIRHRSTIQTSFFSFLAPQIPLASHFRSCVLFHASASTLFHNSAATTFSLSQNFPHHTESRNCQTSEVLRQSRRTSHGLRPQRKRRTGP